MCFLLFLALLILSELVLCFILVGLEVVDVDFPEEVVAPFVLLLELALVHSDLLLIAVSEERPHVFHQGGLKYEPHEHTQQKD